MPGKKQDARVRYTKMVVKSSLLELMRCTARKVRSRLRSWTGARVEVVTAPRLAAPMTSRHRKRDTSHRACYWRAHVGPH